MFEIIISSYSHLLKVDNEDLDLRLKPRLLFLKARALGHVRFNLFFEFSDAYVVLAPEFFDLFLASCGLGVILRLPCHGVAVGLGDLPLEVKPGLGLLFKLDADRLELDFQCVESGL